MPALPLTTRRTVLACLLGAGTSIAIGAAVVADRPARVALADPLDLPTVPSEFARKGTTSGIARHEDRLLAVGPRGLILLSVDAAQTWKQVACPVSTDLVTVKFTDATTAWAIGHDAVALRSTDGGASWRKMLDGRSVLTLLREVYGARATSTVALPADSAVADAMLREVNRSMAQSATKDVFPAPFLDVWFANPNEGFLVGAFGLMLCTTDGGLKWEPCIERLDNERRFHLYAMTGDAAQRYIAGEQGLLLQFDPVSQRYVKVTTPYNGSFFGIDLRGERLVVYGLRGNAYVRLRAGAEWTKVETGTEANLVGAVNLAGDRLVLVSQAGQLIDVAPDMRRAVVIHSPALGEVMGAVAAGPKRIAFARLGGVSALTLEPITH